MIIFLFTKFNILSANVAEYSSILSHNNYVLGLMLLPVASGEADVPREPWWCQSLQPFCSLKSQGGKKSGACYFCSYIVMSATSGLTKQATNLYKRLASLLADKWDQPYSTMHRTLHWLRCSLCFSLLRSAIQCIRGAQSSRGHAMKLYHQTVQWTWL